MVKGIVVRILIFFQVIVLIMNRPIKAVVTPALFENFNLRQILDTFRNSRKESLIKLVEVLDDCVEVIDPSNFQKLAHIIESDDIILGENTFQLNKELLDLLLQFRIYFASFKDITDPELIDIFRKYCCPFECIPRDLEKEYYIMKRFVNHCVKYYKLNYLPETLRHLINELGVERYAKIINYPTVGVLVPDIDSFRKLVNVTTELKFIGLVSLDMVKEEPKMLRFYTGTSSRSDMEWIIDNGSGLRDIHFDYVNRFSDLMTKFITKFTWFAVLDNCAIRQPAIDIFASARLFLENSLIDSKQLKTLFGQVITKEKNEAFTNLILDFPPVFKYFLEYIPNTASVKMPSFITCRTFNDFITTEDHALIMINHLVESSIYRRRLGSPPPFVTPRLATKLSQFISPQEIEVLSHGIITTQYILANVSHPRKSARSAI